MKNSNAASSAQLKYQAKGQLFERMGTVIGAFLVHMLLYLPFAYAVEYINTSKITGLIIYFAASIVITLYAQIFIFGEDYIFLSAASECEVAVSDVFYGFKNKPWKIILVRAIPAVLSVLVKIPGFVLLLSISQMLPDTQTLLSVFQGGVTEEFLELSMELLPYTSLYFALKIFEWAVVIALDIIFSQSLFFMLDYPDYSVTETIRHSVRMMKGNVWRYLYIKISFIPWYLLGALTLVAFLWVYPYYRATMANLYLDIIKTRDEGEY